MPKTDTGCSFDNQFDVVDKQQDYPFIEILEPAPNSRVMFGSTKVTYRAVGRMGVDSTIMVFIHHECFAAFGQVNETADLVFPYLPPQRVRITARLYEDGIANPRSATAEVQFDVVTAYVDEEKGLVVNRPGLNLAMRCRPQPPYVSCMAAATYSETSPETTTLTITRELHMAESLARTVAAMYELNELETLHALEEVQNAVRKMTPAGDSPNRKWVVLAANEDLDTAFSLPLLVSIWEQHVGYTPIVLCVGDLWHSDPALTHVVNTLRTTSSSTIEFFPSSSIDEMTLASLYISYYGELDDDDYLLHANVRYMPLSRSYYHNLDWTKLAHLDNAWGSPWWAGCQFAGDANQLHPTDSPFGAYVHVWREIMLLSDCVAVPTLAQCVALRVRALLGPTPPRLLTPEEVAELGRTKWHNDRFGAPPSAPLPPWSTDLSRLLPSVIALSLRRNNSTNPRNHNDDDNDNNSDHNGGTLGVYPARVQLLRRRGPGMDRGSLREERRSPMTRLSSEQAQEDGGVKAAWVDVEMPLRGYTAVSWPRLWNILDQVIPHESWFDSYREQFISARQQSGQAVNYLNEDDLAGILKGYWQYHKSVRAGEFPPRYLVYSWGIQDHFGFGHMLYELVKTFWYAILTRRAFVVDKANLHETVDRMFKWLCVSLDWDYSIISSNPHLNATSRFVSHADYLPLYADVPVVIHSFRDTTIEFNHLHADPGFLAIAPRIGDVHSHKLIGHLVRHWFRPTPALQGHLDSFLEHPMLKDTDHFVGLQIRTGGIGAFDRDGFMANEDVQTILKCAKHLGRSPRSVYLLLTDKPALRQLAHEVLGERVIYQNIEVKNSCDVDPTDDTMRDSLVDWFLFARTHDAIVSRTSSFAMTSYARTLKMPLSAGYGDTDKFCGRRVWSLAHTCVMGCN